MFSRATALAALLTGVALSTATGAEVQIGERAPGFTLRNTQDEQLTLSSFRGKVVVLEWTSFNCPEVRRLYENGVLQALQNQYTDPDQPEVVWLTLVPSPPGRQTHTSENVVHATMQRYDADPTHVLMDPNYAVGRTWSVGTVPMFFVLNRTGDLVYKGRAGPGPTGSSEKDASGPDASYLDKAISETLAARPVSTPVTEESGCQLDAGSGRH